MELTWMGRYRELIRALIFYSNSSNRSVLASGHADDMFGLSQHEYQILEYICEYEDDNRIMADIAKDTGIIQSNVTKATKRLVSLGLVERYKLVGNRKNVILKPTELGKETYLRYASKNVEVAFRVFFDILKDVPDEQLRTFEASIRALGTDWNAAQRPQLVLSRQDKE